MAKDDDASLTLLSELVQSMGARRCPQQSLQQSLTVQASRMDKPFRDRQPKSTSHAVGVGIAIGSKAACISRADQCRIVACVSKRSLQQHGTVNSVQHEFDSVALYVLVPHEAPLRCVALLQLIKALCHGRQLATCKVANAMSM